MNTEEINEPKKSSNLIILVAILMLLIGFGIGYYITKTYFPEKESVKVDIVKTQEDSITPTPSLTSTKALEDDWFKESEKVVASYLKPMTPDTQEKLRTSNLNTFLMCIENSKQAKDQNSDLFINADIVLGVQNWVENPDISIISSELQNDQILVKARLNNFGQNGINYDFYLTKDIDPVSSDEVWLINDSNNTLIINSTDYNCSR